MIQSVKCLPPKHQGPSSDPQQQTEKPGMAECACNPNTGEAETEGSLGLTGQTDNQSVRDPVSKRS